MPIVKGKNEVHSLEKSKCSTHFFLYIITSKQEPVIKLHVNYGSFNLIICIKSYKRPFHYKKKLSMLMFVHNKIENIKLINLEKKTII